MWFSHLELHLVFKEVKRPDQDYLAEARDDSSFGKVFALHS